MASEGRGATRPRHADRPRPREQRQGARRLSEAQLAHGLPRSRRYRAMVPFSDVMEFAQPHHPCGGIVPAVRPESDGGYLLTLTCACGTVVHRHVTPDEALHVPVATATPARPRRVARPRPTPSPELQRAMQ